MKTKIVFATLLPIPFALSSFSYANDDTTSNGSNHIETITVLGKQAHDGATLGGIDIKNIAINSHVVHRAELERIRFVDPDEFLDRIPGETQVRNLRIPNGGKSYTIPMLDGVPLESPYEGATQRLDRVNTLDIERVEVIKGPASALYPNNAFGGVVNVVSRTPPTESETTVHYEAGDFSRQRFGVATGGQVESVGYFFDANSRSLDGLRDEQVNDRDQVSGKLVFSATEQTTLTFRYEYLDEEVVVRGDLTKDEINDDPTQAGGLSSATDLQQGQWAAKVEHAFDNGGQLIADVVRREKDTIGASRFRGPQDENDVGYGAKLMYLNDVASGALVVGYEGYFGTQDTKQFGRTDFDLEGEFTQFENELDINALFAQYSFDVVEGLNVSTGLRYEDIQLQSSIYTERASFDVLAPKLGVTYELAPNNMLWFNVSEGFYAPDLGSLFDIDEGNPNLKPEEALNIEIGFRGQAGSFSWDTSVYHNKIDNYLVTQEFVRTNGDEFERTTNAGEVTVKGIETVVEFAPEDTNWRIGVTHTFARNMYDSFVQSVPGANDDLSGKELRRSPKHHLNARVAWEPIDSLILELEGDFYSSYFADDANSQDAEFTRDERIHLRVSYEYEDWRFWVHGLNLTDTLEDRATFSRGRMSFRTIDGRTFYAGISRQF